MDNLLLFLWFGDHLENNHFPEVGFLKIFTILIKLVEKPFVAFFTILINVAITNTLLLFIFNCFGSHLELPY